MIFKNKRKRILANTPVFEEELSDNIELLLEEYKHLVSERRFVMSRYSQSLIFYPVIMGYAFKELLAVNPLLTSLIYAGFMILVNTVYWYAAEKFESMAYHALDREALITDRLRLQRPHPMIWGYYAGIISFTLAYVLIIVIVTVKILQAMGRLNIPLGIPNQL